MQFRKTMLAAMLAAFGLACLAGSCHRRHSDFDLPALVLWAWERPENLTWIDPRATGVAFLAGTAVITPNGSFTMRLRTQRLALPPNAAVLAVVRIESPPVHAAVAPGPLIAALLTVANQPGVRGLQIDFDARGSERALYKTLLASLHEQSSRPIGVTALASWCSGDRWLDREPIAEAVPMFFRMGPGESREMAIKSPVCRASIGLSTDEPWPARRPAGIHRIYVFNPHPWTREEYNRVMQRSDAWK